MGEYEVRCAGCKAPGQETRAMRCEKDGGLLRAEYRSRSLTPAGLPGIWTFMDWLPVRNPSRHGGARSATYKSERLARELSLRHLYISFSGYWPEKSAFMRTCSFKELESAPTMQRLAESGGQSVIVLASAGNTARAFAETASKTLQPVILFVPHTSLDRIWTTVEPGNVCLVGVVGDYFDAIVLAERIAQEPGYMPEGGARNIARRDGMGTVVLEAATVMGILPDHYFQAVGSGTGGIAAWEASIRLVQDGRFGSHLPRLHLAQNLPCAPIYSAWTGSIAGDLKKLYGCPAGMYDDVLFNRSPPYAVPGGVRDALVQTNGVVWGIKNEDAQVAQHLFEETEEIDILPAPAVAVAALIKAVESGSIGRNESILLNITGGGLARSADDYPRHRLPPAFEAGPESPVEDIIQGVREFLGS